MKIIQLLVFLLGGVLLSYLCNSLLLRFSKSLGIRNKNDITIRWSNESKPSLGGVSFFVVFVFSAIAYSIVFPADSIFQNKQYVGLFAAGSMAFLMGLADDAYNTKPLLKLSVQILCGFLLVWTDTIIAITSNDYLNAFLTIFWVVLVMNSLNMLDNMDGITGTVVASILVTSLVSNWLMFDVNRNVWSIVIVSVLGGVLGFLWFNVHPSKLFMGDAGSQFIGLFVAYIAIDNLWMSGVVTGNDSWTGILVALVAFTPAAADTLTVVINRLKKGQSPMVGGKDHTTHHLVYAGFNDSKVWRVFLLISIGACALSVSMINFLTLKVTLPLVFFVAYTVVVFVVLYRNTLKYPKQ